MDLHYRKQQHKAKTFMDNEKELELKYHETRRKGDIVYYKGQGLFKNQKEYVINLEKNIENDSVICFSAIYGNVINLELLGKYFNDGNIKGMKENLINLKNLTFYFTSISPAFFVQNMYPANIKSLSLRFNSLNREIIQYLIPLKKLEELTLEENWSTSSNFHTFGIDNPNKRFRYLCMLKNLKKLSLGGFNLKFPETNWLSKLENIIELNIINSEIEDKEIMRIKSKLKNARIRIY